ncbi:MAG TPA: uracil-DNA glycosylase [Syntrophorhabdaceae bacterium]|jgi:DNA polymerase
MDRREAHKFLVALKGMGIDSYAFEKTPRLSLSSIQRQARDCTKCSLAGTRKHVVFGEGDANARLLFIGEAPGEEEDIQGRPFVGRAGKLLDQLIERTGLRRKEVYICNLLKCRPPQNRDPEPSEIALCKEYLFSQLEIVNPRVICTLGRHAYNALFGTDERITRIRGALTKYRGALLLPTYHPSFLLRNNEKIKEAWEDMERLRQLLH